MTLMDRFIAATEPVLREALQGTGIKATYWRTYDGGEVQLHCELAASLCFDDDHIVADFEEAKAEEALALVRGFREMLSDASAARSKFAPLEPIIELGFA